MPFRHDAGVFRPNAVSRRNFDGLKTPNPSSFGHRVCLGKKVEAKNPNGVSAKCAIGRISSASPQLGAAKRGQEAGVAPGRSTPIRPRLPPGPAGAPWRAKRKAVNERQSQAHRNREAIAIENVCTRLVSLPIFHSPTWVLAALPIQAHE